MWSESGIKPDVLSGCRHARYHPTTFVSVIPEQISNESIKVYNSTVKSKDQFSNFIKNKISGSTNRGTNVETSLNFCKEHTDSCFTTSSKVLLQSGELRNIGSITKQDFIDTCQHLADMTVEQMVVTHMKENHDMDSVTLGFALDDKTQVVMETSPEHPFFDLDKGWTSYNPLRAWHKFGISCRQLIIGSRCLYLLDHCSDVN